MVTELNWLNTESELYNDTIVFCRAAFEIIS